MRRALSLIGSLISSLFGLAFFALLLTPILGPPIYVEMSGRSASGTVIAKRETIAPLSEIWSRRLLVDVRYLATDVEEEETITIGVHAATYDQMRVGDEVQLRYMPNATLRQIGNIASARLESQPPMGSFMALLGDRLASLLIAIGIWVALLLIWVKSHIGVLVPVLAFSMIGGVIYIGSGWPAPAPPGEMLAGNATVRDLKRIERVWGGRRTSAEDAVQPFMVVELEFVPTGRVDPVVAVDMVDDSSVRALERGVDVPIHYSAADPRWAQLDNAARTYYWKNLRTFGIIGLIIFVLLLFGWLRRPGRLKPRARVTR
jgi:hypothetical protein